VGDTLPRLVVYHDGAHFHYPVGNKLEVDPIRVFLTSFLKGELSEHSALGQIVDDTLDQLIPDFRVLDKNQMKDLLKTEGRDLFIVSYTSRFVIET